MLSLRAFLLACIVSSLSACSVLRSPPDLPDATSLPPRVSSAPSDTSSAQTYPLPGSGLGAPPLLPLDPPVRGYRAESLPLSTVCADLGATLSVPYRVLVERTLSDPPPVTPISWGTDDQPLPDDELESDDDSDLLVSVYWPSGTLRSRATSLLAAAGVSVHWSDSAIVCTSSAYTLVRFPGISYVPDSLLSTLGYEGSIVRLGLDLFLADPPESLRAFLSSGSFSSGWDSLRLSDLQFRAVEALLTASPPSVPYLLLPSLLYAPAPVLSLVRPLVSSLTDDCAVVPWRPPFADFDVSGLLSVVSPFLCAEPFSASDSLVVFGSVDPASLLNILSSAFPPPRYVRLRGVLGVVDSGWSAAFSASIQPVEISTSEGEETSLSSIRGFFAAPSSLLLAHSSDTRDFALSLEGSTGWVHTARVWSSMVRVDGPPVVLSDGSTRLVRTGAVVDDSGVLRDTLTRQRLGFDLSARVSPHSAGYVVSHELESSSPVDDTATSSFTSVGLTALSPSVPAIAVSLDVSSSSHLLQLAGVSGSSSSRRVVLVLQVDS